MVEFGKLKISAMNVFGLGQSLTKENNRDSRSLQKCPYCLGASRPFISSTDRNRGTTSSVFHYFRCSDCGLVFMDPIPRDLAPFYSGGYQPIPKSLAELRKIAARARHRMEPVLKYKKGGRLLEIGPWIGIFSCNAKDAGFDVTAIEMDQNCVDFLNETLGIRALQSADPVGSLAELDEKFDVIALWHCLEHLRDPWLVIQQAANHLAPGGILIVAIPNIESYEYSLLKSAWRHLDAPRHLFFFPIESLVNLCQRCGLSKVEVTTTDELSDELSLDTWYRLVNSLVPIHRMAVAVARLLRYAARRREMSSHAGAGITAVFQLVSGEPLEHAG